MTLWLVVSRRSILSCAAGAITIASVPGPATCSGSSIYTSGIGSGGGSCGSTKGSGANGPDYGVCRVWPDRDGKSGARSAWNSFFSPAYLSSAFGVVGCLCLSSPAFLESRMHNERCMSGSERGHAKPSIARSTRRAWPTPPFLASRVVGQWFYLSTCMSFWMCTAERKCTARLKMDPLIDAFERVR